MSNVFEEVQQSRVFSNETLLTPEFLPDVLPGREKHVRQIAENLKPFALGRKCPPLLLFGPPGAGKTSCSPFFFK